MRNKPQKLYLLIGRDGAAYRSGGAVQAYRSQGKALKKSKQLYQRSALLYTVVRAGLSLGGLRDAHQA